MDLILDLELTKVSTTQRAKIHKKALESFLKKPLTEERLVTLNQQAKTVIAKYKITKTKYYNSIIQAIYLECVQEALAGGKQRIVSEFSEYFRQNQLFRWSSRSGILS